MSVESSSQTELFKWGAEPYLDALAAIEAFEGEVQDTCKEVCNRHAEELAKQMGLDAADFEPFAEKDAKERWAELGVSRPAEKGCDFYLYLWWDEVGNGQPRIEGTVYLYVSRQDLRDDIHDRSHQKNARCRLAKDGTWGLMMSTPIEANDLTSAGQVLDDLMSEWLDYCRSAGGLGLKEEKT